MAKPVSFRDKFRQQKEKLASHHQEQVNTRDSGTEYPSIIDKTKLPEGRTIWKPKAGEYLIDIIPFFAGSQHPKVSEGDLSYVIDLWVHQGVGPLNTPYVCQTKTFHENDPICEYIASKRIPTDEWKKISAKRRTLYLVWVHDEDRKEEKKGIQIWDVAHFFFEAKVDEIAKSPRGGGAISFSDVDNGKSIAFTIRKSGTYTDAGGQQRDSLEYLGHRFIDREKPIPEKILEQTFALDEVIVMHPDDEEVSDAFYGRKNTSGRTTTAEEDDIPFDEPKSERKSSSRRKPEPEPEVEDESGFGDDDFGNDDDGEGFSDEEPNDSDSNEDEFSDSGDDDFGDEGETTECPHDPDSFGEVNKHPECDDCPLFDDCSVKAKEIAKQKAGNKKQGQHRKLNTKK